ncbi:MAG: sulfurtransferase TusA family protein [Nocardioidaceae bacterium]
MADATLVLDCRGQLCPVPIIELGKAFGLTEPGQELTLITDDPAAASDVAAWCRLRGQLLVSESPAAPSPTGRAATAYVIRHS